MKRFLLHIVAIASLCVHNACESALNQETVTFAWDCHDVLLKRQVFGYKPRRKLQKLIEELKELGYLSHRVATNMPTVDYHAFAAQFTELFAGFKPGLSIDAAHSIAKPRVAFFNTFNQLFNPAGSETVIFIDDKVKNVEGSRKAGMIGIHFKNVQQLRAELRKLGIPVKK